MEILLLPTCGREDRSMRPEHRGNEIRELLYKLWNTKSNPLYMTVIQHTINVFYEISPSCNTILERYRDKTRWCNGKVAVHDWNVQSENDNSCWFFGGFVFTELMGMVLWKQNLLVKYEYSGWPSWEYCFLSAVYTSNSSAELIKFKPSPWSHNAPGQVLVS